MEPAEATVFVIDDDQGSRDSVAALVSSEGLACETFASAEEFLQRFDPQRPGCAVIDLRLEEMSGLELQQHLADVGSTLPVIIISGYADVSSAVRAMKRGAVTVLEKPYRDNQLMHAIGTAMEMDRVVRDKLRRQADLRQRVESLTARERRAMEMILRGEPNKAIARQLGVSQRTVDRIRSEVFERMGAESAVELAQLVTGLELKPLRLDSRHAWPDRPQIDGVLLTATPVTSGCLTH